MEYRGWTFRQMGLGVYRVSTRDGGDRGGGGRWKRRARLSEREGGRDGT